MLFVQSVTISYYKNVRYPEYANLRRNMKFFPVKFEIKDKNAEALVDTVRIFQGTEGINYFSQHMKTYGKDIFEKNKWYNLPVDSVVKVIKDNDNYEMIYRSYNKKLFTLEKGQYGRVIYNYRTVECDWGIWIYRFCILNYINDDREKFREKIFFRKNPDYEFKDFKYMRYC